MCIYVSIPTYFAVSAPEAYVAAVTERPGVRGQTDGAILTRTPQTVVHVRLSHVLHNARILKDKITKNMHRVGKIRTC